MAYKIKSVRAIGFKKASDARNFAIRNKIKNASYGYNKEQKHFVAYEEK